MWTLTFVCLFGLLAPAFAGCPDPPGKYYAEYIVKLLPCAAKVKDVNGTISNGTAPLEWADVALGEMDAASADDWYGNCVYNSKVDTCSLHADNDDGDILGFPDCSQEFFLKVTWKCPGQEKQAKCSNIYAHFGESYMKDKHNIIINLANGTMWTTDTPYNERGPGIMGGCRNK